MPMSPRLLRPRQSLHPEAADWAARVTAAGATCSGTTLTAVSKFCRSIDAAGIRSKFLRLNLFCGSSITAALIPLYRSSAYGGAAVGNASDTNNNFVSGDYSESGGLTKTASTSKYLDTGLAPEDFDISTGHLAVYRGAFSASNVALLSVRSLTDYYEIFKRGDSKHHAAFGSTTLAVPSTETTHASAGLIVGSRTGATTLRYFFAGAQTAENTTSVTPANTSHNWFVFAMNNNGSAASYTGLAQPLYGYSIGRGMTNNDVQSYTSAMNALQTSIGRQV
jgi:hypothetical protein